MKTLTLALLFALSTTACASFKALTPEMRATRIIRDAQFGVDAACQTQWLTADECAFARHALDTARAVVARDPFTALEAAAATVATGENLLPVDSHLRPYLDALVAALHKG